MTLLEFFDRWDERRVSSVSRFRRQGVERQAFTFGLFVLTMTMFLMARENPALWDVKLFEVIFQAIVLTGLLNMAAAFHFAANKQSEHAAFEAAARASEPTDDPQPVVVTNRPSDPVPTTTGDDELPDYAR